MLILDSSGVILLTYKGSVTEDDRTWNGPRGREIQGSGWNSKILDWKMQHITQMTAY